MQDRGVLTISTGTAVLPRDLHGPVEEVTPGEYVVLTVADSGAGMPPDVLARVFEPFFTTKKFGGGSGLGLSMVYGFVRQSHIEVESTVGAGSVFRLYMPRAAADVKEAYIEHRPERKPSGHEVILVVEDDSRVRKTASNILRKQGYSVIEASNSSEALRAAETLPRLDLLFTDVVLANGMNGVELTHQVLRRRPQTCILLTSGDTRHFQVPRLRPAAKAVPSGRVDGARARASRAVDVSWVR
jgi:CheY-like chemotaxis protein